jgi:hypothetical protein
VHALRGDDPEVAVGKLGGVRGGAYATDEVGGAREPEAVLVDGCDVVDVEVVGPDLDVVELGEVNGEEGANGAATDDADSHE